MSQFDPLIIFSLLGSLLITLLFYYSISTKVVVPNFFGAKKFRTKKLNSIHSFVSLNKNLTIKTSSSYCRVLN